MGDQVPMRLPSLGGAVPSGPPNAGRNRRRLATAGFLALLLLIVLRGLAGWRFFPGFMGDQGWYLQVALRVSQGQVLYRDVAWAYGPLPIQALAALFRWLGPDAALATLINGILALLAVVLTYIALRSLLSPALALAFTAFAALSGPYVGGDLFRLHFYVYSQAVAWGSVTSLVALVAVLQWQRHRRGPWLAVAGVATALAFLCKLEFGLPALGATVAVVAASRGSVADWIQLLGSALVTGLVGFGWQASSSGAYAIWRGYRNYDHLASGGPWGLQLAAPRWLLSVYLIWAPVLAVWAARRWPRRRIWAYGLAILAVLLLLVLLLPDLLGESGRSLLARAQSDTWQGLQLRPGGVLAWLAAAPWAPLLLFLLIAGWLAWRRRATPAWWGLWSFAVLSNLRYPLTGYASGYALAPSLAVLWWLFFVHSVDPARPASDKAGQRRLALAVLGLLAVSSLAAQGLLQDAYFNEPRGQVQTALGPVTIPAREAVQVEAVQAVVQGAVPPGQPILTTSMRGAGWYPALQRPNPTMFDVILPGLGTAGADAARTLADLAQDPPQAVILPSLYGDVSTGTVGTPSEALAVRQGLASWWDLLALRYQDRTPPEASDWIVLIAQP